MHDKGFCIHPAATYMMTYPELHALQWYLDAGVDCAVSAATNNRWRQEVDLSTLLPDTQTPAPVISDHPQKTIMQADIFADIRDKINACDTLDALRNLALSFEDHPHKRTATNLVFGDGDPAADILFISDPPSNAEDISGKAFDGEAGALMDKIMTAIGLSRLPSETTASAYLMHITYWRPPGNSTPTAEHLSLVKPLIERHITLIKPRHIVMMGGMAARTLLGRKEAISRIRGQWFGYGPQSIPTLVTYTPDYLMNNPLQKRKVWHDMLALQDRRNG